MFISGEWEFGELEASRLVWIPRHLGTHPSKDRDLLAFFFFFAFISAGLTSFYLLCRFPSEKTDGQENRLGEK